MVGEKDLQLIVCPCVFQPAGLLALAQSVNTFFFYCLPVTHRDPLSSAPSAAEPCLHAAPVLPPSPERLSHSSSAVCRL